MKLHYLQHVPFEGLGYIETWAKENSITVSYTKMFNNKKLPQQNEFDFLVVMGGPMSVNNEDIYGWLKDEKEFVLETIQNNKPVLGICLGAQMIAKALGAKVYPNAEKEIGWFTVKNITGSALSGLLPREYEIFQWHGDTFDLPDGAVHLAESPVCVNQAFVYGNKVIGLQFHLESTSDTIDKLITNCADELIDAPYIQSAEEMKSGIEKTYSTNKLMKIILDYLVS
jgi:GMP synthase-like glutamine amidotransferase